jgi:glycosyltransferase A (GT-A) superfamily protein (DUF2064 family)
MNDESHISESLRALLGPEAAGELARDERWLADRLGRPEAAPLPGSVRTRLTQAISVELAAQRSGRVRHSDWRIAAAAMVLFALLVGLFARFILPRRPTDRIAPVVGTSSEVRLAAAQKAVDAYVGSVDSYLRTVDTEEVQMHVEMKRLDRALASPEGADNPWQAVAGVIENGR